MNDLLSIITLEALLQRECRFRGVVAVGGSQTLGEAGNGSDQDWYVIAQGFLDLRRVLRAKQRIIEWKKETNSKAQIILVTPWLMRHAFFYLDAVDGRGHRYVSAVNPRVLRYNFLKVGYQELVSAKLSPEQASYHLGKALVYGLASLAWARRVTELLSPPFVSVKKTIASLPQFHLSQPVHEVARLVEAKMEEPHPASDHDLSMAEAVLEEVCQSLARAPIAWQNYLLYTLFSLRQGKGFTLVGNPDRRVIDGFRKAYETGDKERFMAMKQETNKVLII